MPTKFDPHHLTWYIDDVCMHARGAQLAFLSLSSVVDADNTRQSRVVWFHLTSFLQHAAMISKFLKPISKTSTALARQAALREALGVHLESEVLPRDARDNVEHFDERLDGWTEDPSPTIIEIVLDERADYEHLCGSDKRVRRLLIADEMVFVSERSDGSRFELKLDPVKAEIDRILQAAEAWLCRASPYQFIFPGR